MRPTRYVAIALGILVLVAAGTAMWWRSSDTRRASGSPDSPGSVPSAAESASELGLQVNGTTSASIPAGSPVFFTVTVTAPVPESWATSLRFETADDKPFASRVEPLGPPLTFKFAGDRRAETTDAGKPEQRVASPMLRAEFGASPEESGRIPVGAHTIRVVLPVDKSASASGRLVSNTVTLTVEGPDAAAAASPAAEKARLEFAARFHLLAEKWEEAHRLALQLVGRQDADTVAYILLGDALNGLKRNGEALAAYQEALASSARDSDEAPEYLIARMEEVRQRLEASKGKKE